MMLFPLIDGLPIELIRGSASTRITEIVEDSRRAAPGALFVARPGLETDGRRFVADAIARGASAVVAASDGRVLGELAERFHGRPSRALRVVGVTGTNGKTTVTHLVHQVLRAAGVRCGLVGTVHVDDGRGLAPAAMTTPPAPEVSRLLASMVGHGCAAAVLEVSSHALDQGRTAGIAFDAGVFTNLTGDHLDYHGSLEAYADAKSILFESLPPEGVAVLNLDDPAASRMARSCPAPVLTCSLHEPGAACRAAVTRRAIGAVDASLHGPWGVLDVRLPLAGEHNVANALQAAAVCGWLGVDASTMRDALVSCTAPPGRLEAVTGPHDEFTVLVDYAHTDDALANVLRALRPLVPRGGRLRVVFGCGGDRDRSKRPRMGRVAGDLADEVIITSDNPRTEDPQGIIDEILPGVNGRPAEARPDRREAIELAVGRSRPGDVVLIAGKGHEPYQIVGTERRPFDDRLVAAEAVARRRGS